VCMVGPPAHLQGPPDAIILSGPDFYVPFISQLYGGYKRTRNLYGRVTYQKDPDQGDAGSWEAFIYWSAVDTMWCIGPRLGAALGEMASPGGPVTNAVLVYQKAEDDAVYPNLMGSWAVNLYGTGARYQVDHMLTFESLDLPAEAADPARSAGGYMHICARKFVDYEFPPRVTTIEGDSPPLRKSIPNRLAPEAAEWVAASSFAKQLSGPLFDERSEPRGDWLAGLQPHRGGLYPVFAALREYPGHLEQLFALNPEVAPLGRYRVWLYDIWKGKWQPVCVDEYVPVVHVGSGARWPWFGGHGKTIWALLLEKALAKFCGSYEALRRCESAPLIMALTGESSRLAQWRSDNGWWSQWGYMLPESFVNPPARTTAGAAAHPSMPPATPELGDPKPHHRVHGVRPLKCSRGRVGGSWQQARELFVSLRELHRGNALLFACADAGYDDAGDPASASVPEGMRGLQRGKGYSLLGLVEVEEGEQGGGLQLVQLRNPWGAALQWSGPWSDGSAEWEQYPEVRRHHLRAEHSASGRFWMAWPDFCELFDRVEVCPMPAAARKASYVPRLLRSRRAAEGNSRRAAGGSFPLDSLFQWRCCAVSPGKKERICSVKTSEGSERIDAG